MPVGAGTPAAVVQRVEAGVDVEVRDPGLADLLAVAAAQAKLQQRRGGAAAVGAGAHELGAVDEGLRQAHAGGVVDGADDVALAAVDAVQRTVERGRRRRAQGDAVPPRRSGEQAGEAPRRAADRGRGGPLPETAGEPHAGRVHLADECARAPAQGEIDDDAAVEQRLRDRGPA